MSEAAGLHPDAPAIVRLVHSACQAKALPNVAFGLIAQRDLKF